MKSLFQFFSSLKLTVVLLAFSMMLIFFGTLEQVQHGIWKTQKDYFESVYVVWNHPQPLYVRHEAPQGWKKEVQQGETGLQASYVSDRSAFLTISVLPDDNDALLSALNARRSAADLPPMQALSQFNWNSEQATDGDALFVEARGKNYSDLSHIFKTDEGIWIVSFSGANSAIESAMAAYNEFISEMSLERRYPLLHILHIPMPGGYLLGGLLFVNLLAAHFSRFKMTWKKSGIFLVHFGLVLLLVSELLTDLLAVESQMPVDEGGRSHYSQAFRANELVFIDRSHPDYDQVHSIPASMLKPGKRVEVPDTPLSVRTVSYYPNAELGRATSGAPAETPATRGAAVKMGIFLTPQAETFAEGELNTTSAYVEVLNGDESLGVWLVSNVIDERFPPQIVETGDQAWEVALRFTRHYYPFEIELIDFSHDKYPGTEIPFNFSSEVMVHHFEDSSKNQKALIYMNHPLRYEGLTFYQASFANQDRTSIFQVVRNPGWLLPYISVLLMGLGMCVQFGMHFYKFLKKRSA